MSVANDYYQCTSILRLLIWPYSNSLPPFNCFVIHDLEHDMGGGRVKESGTDLHDKFYLSYLCFVLHDSHCYILQLILGIHC